MVEASSASAVASVVLLCASATAGVARDGGWFEPLARVRKMFACYLLSLLKLISGNAKGCDNRRLRHGDRHYLRWRGECRRVASYQSVPGLRRLFSVDWGSGRCVEKPRPEDLREYRLRLWISKGEVSALVLLSRQSHRGFVACPRSFGGAVSLGYAPVGRLSAAGAGGWRMGGLAGCEPASPEVSFETPATLATHGIVPPR